MFDFDFSDMKWEDIDWKQLDYIPLSMKDYDLVHLLEAKVSINEAILTRIEQELPSLRAFMEAQDKRMTDMEAEKFAEKIERDLALEKWSDEYSAYIGRKLGDIAQKLIDLEGEVADEDAQDIISDAYVSIFCLMSELEA